MTVQTTLFIGAALLLSACNTLSAAHDFPAVIVSPTEQSRAELLRIVTNALYGAKLMLADDALTQSSLLNIERSAHRDLRGRQFNGRELGMPHQFRLLRNGSQCVLVKLPDEGRWVLAETSCIVEFADEQD